MRKKNSKRILGRTADHRRDLLRNLSDALLLHGSIVTSEAKGKELRTFIEPLITQAKKELTLARRRKLLADLKSREALVRLVEVAAKNNARTGGYLRLTKLPRTRSDFAKTVRVDFVTNS